MGRAFFRRQDDFMDEVRTSSGEVELTEFEPSLRRHPHSSSTSRLDSYAGTREGKFWGPSTASSMEKVLVFGYLLLCMKALGCMVSCSDLAFCHILSILDCCDSLVARCSLLPMPVIPHACHASPF